jgi:hypothetical protein
MSSATFDFTPFFRAGLPPATARWTGRPKFDFIGGNKEHSKSRLRLCFASPSHEEIHEGVAALAEVCRCEFNVRA